jgi:hypothetical protein
MQKIVETTTKQEIEKTVQVLNPKIKETTRLVS